MRNLILPVLIFGFMALNAPAAVTSTFNQTDPGATLVGYTSNTWDVNTATDSWLSGQLLLQLTAGDIYQDSVGNDAPPNPALFVTNPTLQYDSYMTGGTDSAAPSTTGPLPSIMGGAVDLGGAVAATFDTSTIDATWVSSLATNPSGDLTLARITLSDNAQGIYSYRIGVDNNQPTSFVGGFIVNGAMTQPVLTSTFTQTDPGTTLSGYVSNTWDVNTLGDKWLSAELIVDLTAGNIYQDGVGTDAPPNPALFGTNPTLQYDSYMTGGTDSEAPSTTGTLPSLIGGAVDIGGAIAATFDMSSIDATWITSLATNPSGELMLGRITLSDDACGTYKIRIGLEDGGASFFLGGTIVDGVMGTMEIPLIPGDFDSDGDVDVSDLGVLATNYGQGPGKTLSEGDANDDGYVNVSDLGLLATNYGVGTAAASAVPEPCTAALLVLMAAMGLAMRRRTA